MPLYADRSTTKISAISVAQRFHSLSECLCIATHLRIFRVSTCCYLFSFFALYLCVYTRYDSFTSNTLTFDNIAFTYSIYILAGCYFLISRSTPSYFIFSFTLSTQMVMGKFISINTRGISNYGKSRTIFTWCRKQKADVISLQETHSTEKNETQWKKEWGAPFYCSHGASNARGVGILIRNNFDCVVEQKEANTHGRFLILKVLLKETNCFTLG